MLVGCYFHGCGTIYPMVTYAMDSRATIKKSHPVMGDRWDTLKTQIDGPLTSILTLNTIAHTIGAATAGARVTSLFSSVLWPAEDTVPAGVPVANISFEYPRSDLGWLPGSGELGVLLVFLVASMLFGVAVPVFPGSPCC